MIKASKQKQLVKKIEIEEIQPGHETKGYIRFISQADNQLWDVIPTILINIPPGKTQYIEKENTLSMRLANRNVTLFSSGKIYVTNTRDLDEAHLILKAIKKIINEAYRDYLKYGKPSHEEIEMIKNLTWKDIYQYLPKVNCGKCGYPICSTFAVSVLLGEAILSECELLKEPEYASNIKNLKEKFGSVLVSSLGWH
ncbi:MAG: hypothetical protein EU539_04660 [Promethearchaeota archaeon]|nr:MAG: hypothetical protein EU539_04660 [Candidatus Lokiarchaeota archaeon]